MKYLIIFLAIGLFVSLMAYDKLRTENMFLEEKLVLTEAKAASWRKVADEAASRTHAVQGVAEACLAREQAAQADFDQWANLIEQSRSRDLTHEEQGKVPDENARKALFDSLDRPL